MAWTVKIGLAGEPYHETKLCDAFCILQTGT